jgi:hypothetical protein
MQCLTRHGPRSRPGQLACELEREERVSPACVQYPSDLGSRQLERQTRIQERTKLACTERRRRQPREPFSGESTHQIQPRLGRVSRRGENPDRLLPKPPQRDLEHRRRGRIEPLDVVERHQERTALAQRAQDVEQGQTDRMRVRRLRTRLDKQ